MYAYSNGQPLVVAPAQQQVQFFSTDTAGEQLDFPFVQGSLTELKPVYVAQEHTVKNQQWTQPEGHGFEELMQELFSNSPTEEEQMDAEEIEFKEVRGTKEQLEDKREQDVRKMLTIEGDTVNGVNDKELVEMANEAPSEAKAENETTIRITQDPQLLNQSSIPKPWEEAQSPNSTYASSESSKYCPEQPALSHDSDLDAKISYMKTALNQHENIVHENGSNGKHQVHQIVHLLLLSTVNDTAARLKLGKVLTFCDNQGHPSKGRQNHFKTMDTKTMGLIWQKIKGNRDAKYDTFARAMRVCRERKKGYFKYLESGKGSKKKIYRLGEKSRTEMKRMEELLPRMFSN